MTDNKFRAQSLEKGAAVLLISTVLVKLIGAFFKIPLSSDVCLGDLGFGYFSSVYDIFNPFYNLAITGFPVAVSHIIADLVAKNRFSDVNAALFASRRIFLRLGIIATFIMLLLIFPFVRLTDKTGQSIYGLFAMLPTVLFCCVASVYRGYYEGLRNMTYPAVSNIIEALCKLILGFGFAFLTVKFTGNTAFGAAAAMLGISIGTVLSALYLHIRFKKQGSDFSQSLNIEPQKYNPDFEKKLAKMLFAFAVPVAISSLAGSMVAVIDALTVRAQLSVMVRENYGVLQSMYSSALSDYTAAYGQVLSKEALPTFLYGIRSKAITLYNLVPTFTSAIGISAVPFITELFAKNDIIRLKRNVIKTIKLTSFIAFPAGIGLFALSYRIMELLYGAGGSAQAGGKMLAVYGIAAIFSGLGVVLCCVLQAVKRQNAVLINVLIGMVVKLIANITLTSVPKLNVHGAVLSTLICYAVIFLLNIISLLKAVGKLSLMKSALLKPFLAAILCGVCAFIISLISASKIITVIAVSVAVLVYLSALLLLRFFEIEEITEIPFGKKLLKILKKLKIVNQNSEKMH